MKSDLETISDGIMKYSYSPRRDYLDEAHAMMDYYANAAETLVAFVLSIGAQDACFLWLKEKHESGDKAHDYIGAIEYLDHNT